jgi:hypothetical protein
VKLKWNSIRLRLAQIAGDVDLDDTLKLPALIICLPWSWADGTFFDYRQVEEEEEKEGESEPVTPTAARPTPSPGMTSAAQVLWLIST